MPQQKIANETEIRVIGMSRSGSHAVVNWILSQWHGRCCYLNCTEPGANPFATARPFDDGSCWRANYDCDLEAERAGDFSHKDLLIYNHEDAFLGLLRRAEARAQHEAYVGRSGRRIDVLVLRDPFNLFASRMAFALRKQNGLPELPSGTALRIWRQHAREFLERRYLTENPRLLLNFNRWATDRGYRRATAQALGMTFTDAGAEAVPEVGGGSSFDGVRYDGAASRMALNRRWEHLADDPCYVSIFDAETVELSRRIFGEVCKLEMRLRPGDPCAAGMPLNGL